jgi:hypothetical protein
VALLYDVSASKWHLYAANTHGAMGDLTVDDHTQYLLADGTRDLTKLVYEDTTELTISGGSITVTQSTHTVDTEGEVGADNLTTIAGGAAQQKLYLYAEDAGRVVTIRDSGNIVGMADFTLSATKPTILMYDGANWQVTGGHGYYDKEYLDPDVTGYIDPSVGGTGADLGAVSESIVVIEASGILSTRRYSDGVPPTVNDDSDDGFGVYSPWKGTDNIWMCLDASVGAAVWLRITTPKLEANTAGVGAPNVITAAEDGRTFTNEGATALNYHTLPAAAADLRLEFIVQDDDGIRVTAAAGDTIRLGDKVTIAAGYIESTEIGAAVSLVAVNATEWIATSIVGNWTVETS